MSHGTFATVINCMDGRTQLPANAYLKNKFNVDYIDTITEPGPDKILAENTDAQIITNIKKRVLISTQKHGSKIIAIVAHTDCAGNPVEKEKHLAHLKKALNTLALWHIDAQLISLWIDENWQVNEIS